MYIIAQKFKVRIVSVKEVFSCAVFCGAVLGPNVLFPIQTQGPDQVPGPKKIWFPQPRVPDQDSLPGYRYPDRVLRP